MSTNKDNEVSVTVDKVVTIGGHDTPPKKKKDKDKDDPMIPINESDVDGLDYITEG